MTTTQEPDQDPDQDPTVPDGFVLTTGPGLPVLVPEAYPRWGPMEQRGYLAGHVVNAAEARTLTFAYDCVEHARVHDTRARDPWETAAATLRAAMSSTRGAAARLVATAVDLTERLPRCHALLVAGWIGLAAAHVIVEQTRMVAPEHMPALDAVIASRLAPTRRRTHAPRPGPLRKLITKAVLRCDPVGAAARARAAALGQDVEVQPLRDDMAVVSAVVTADTAVEIMDRIDVLARSAGPDDPRSLGERRAAGLLALSRGWTCLPDAEGNLPGDPGAMPAARKVSLHLYDDEGSLDLAGYGPVSDFTRERLLRAAETRRHSVSDLADPTSEGAARYAPSDALRRFCQGRDGSCVFPGCEVPAERTDLDHIIPFDHDDPARGGRTTGDDLADLCRHHHRLKTEGLWVYWRNPDGGYTWVHGPTHPDPDPGTLIVVEPTGPLARHAAPKDPVASRRQQHAAEQGRTGGRGESTRRGPHRRVRRDDERRRLRARVLHEWAAATSEPAAPPVDDDPPPF